MCARAIAAGGSGPDESGQVLLSRSYVVLTGLSLPGRHGQHAGRQEPISLHLQLPPHPPGLRRAAADAIQARHRQPRPAAVASLSSGSTPAELCRYRSAGGPTRRPRCCGLSPDCRTGLGAPAGNSTPSTCNARRASGHAGSPWCRQAQWRGQRAGRRRAWRQGGMRTDVLARESPAPASRPRSRQRPGNSSRRPESMSSRRSCHLGRWFLRSRGRRWAGRDRPFQARAPLNRTPRQGVRRLPVPRLLRLETAASVARAPVVPPYHCKIITLIFYSELLIQFRIGLRFLTCRQLTCLFYPRR